MNCEIKLILLLFLSQQIAASKDVVHIDNNAVFAITWMAGHCETLGNTCDQTKYEQWDQYNHIYSVKASPYMDYGLHNKLIENMVDSILIYSKEKLCSKRCTAIGLLSPKEEDFLTFFGNSNGREMDSAMQTS